jgi:hypothetical protein
MITQLLNKDNHKYVIQTLRMFNILLAAINCSLY